LKKEADNGKYIHGLFLEGATWEMGTSDAPNMSGYLLEQKPKELRIQL